MRSTLCGWLQRGAQVGVAERLVSRQVVPVCVQRWTASLSIPEREGRDAAECDEKLALGARGGAAAGQGGSGGASMAAMGGQPNNQGVPIAPPTGAGAAG